MPRIIIEGAEIKTNVKFLSDYENINYGKSTLSSINKSIIERRNFKSDVLISSKKNVLNINFLDNLNRSIQLTRNDKWVTLTFNKDLNLIATKKSQTKLSFFNHDWVEHSWQHPDWVHNPLELTVHIDKFNIKSAYFGNYLDTGIWFKPSLGKILIKRSQIDMVSKSNSFQSYFKPKEYEKNIYNISQEEYMKTNNRFIAHAGSMIDGHTYTNSLEALNQSYKSGFRLFELDILTTSDNFFVAAHDWETWKKMSGYSGSVPVSKKTFMSYKILGKYSPLDGEMINSWFKKHSDAILITDKINEPKIF